MRFAIIHKEVSTWQGLSSLPDSSAARGKLQKIERIKNIPAVTRYNGLFIVFLHKSYVRRDYFELLMVSLI
ncbi:MAG: hypothetical protein CVV47_03355 [Spirochaetae bacterium HGW-Spirochaetae-3]|nr:MAG: hypothetical protein CVV47_03355 [Spirochaetae bacterium HGW-Spirochaetae-3]